MVQAGHRHLPDRFYADNAAVPRTADLPGSYVAWVGNHAGGKRSAGDCAAVWTGQFGQGQRDERCLRHHHSGQPYPQRGKGGEIERFDGAYNLLTFDEI